MLITGARTVAWAGAAGAVVTALSAVAWADGSGNGRVVCPPPGMPGACQVISTSTSAAPGSGGSQHREPSPSGPQECKDSSTRTTVSCTMPGYGWWSSPTNCYYKLASPQPPANDPRWEGHRPGDGAVYDTYCPDGNGPGNRKTSLNGTQWLAAPPPGFGGGASPAQLALRAVKDLPIDGPDIGLAPDPKSLGGTVGVPVWMWTAKTSRTWGPATASATAGAVTVTATAKVSKIVWSMGDGHAVTCTSAGTPYRASYGMARSPDCGYLYASTSAQQPGGMYRITATSTWAIHWTGGGEQGDLTTTRSSQVRLAVGELQVVGG